MSSLKRNISEKFGKIFQEMGFEAKFGQVVESQRPDLCQFQCNGALAVAKSAKKIPEKLPKLL